MSNPSHKKKLIAYAAALAAEQGHRWTEMREQVYATLIGIKGHITAYELIEKLSRQQEKDIKPASVYRALDALCELGLAVKIESLNSFRACLHPQEKHQHVFLVCDNCGHTDEMADHHIGRILQKDAAAHGFRARRQVLELHGDCSDCQA